MLLVIIQYQIVVRHMRRILKINNFTVKIYSNGCTDFPYEYKIRMGDHWRKYLRKYFKSDWVNSGTSFSDIASCINEMKKHVGFYDRNKTPLPQVMWSKPLKIYK